MSQQTDKKESGGFLMPSFIVQLVSTLVSFVKSPETRTQSLQVSFHHFYMGVLASIKKNIFKKLTVIVQSLYLSEHSVSDPDAIKLKEALGHLLEDRYMRNQYEIKREILISLCKALEIDQNDFPAITSQDDQLVKAFKQMRHERDAKIVEHVLMEVKDSIVEVFGLDESKFDLSRIVEPDESHKLDAALAEMKVEIYSGFRMIVFNDRLTERKKTVNTTLETLSEMIARVNDIKVSDLHPDAQTNLETLMELTAEKRGGILRSKLAENLSRSLNMSLAAVGDVIASHHDINNIILGDSAQDYLRDVYEAASEEMIDLMHRISGGSRKEDSGSGSDSGSDPMFSMYKLATHIMELLPVQSRPVNVIHEDPYKGIAKMLASLLKGERAYLLALVNHDIATGFGADGASDSIATTISHALAERDGIIDYKIRYAEKILDNRDDLTDELRDIVEDWKVDYDIEGVSRDEQLNYEMVDNLLFRVYAHFSDPTAVSLDDSIVVFDSSSSDLPVNVKSTTLIGSENQTEVSRFKPERSDVAHTIDSSTAKAKVRARNRIEATRALSELIKHFGA